MNLTLGIIGGNGKMARAFARAFTSYFKNIIISDIGTNTSNVDVVTSSDIVLIACPIKAIESVISEIAPHIKATQLVCDIASLKKPLAKLYAEIDAEVVSLHPMCNETQFVKGAKVLFMNVRKKSHSDFLKDMLIQEGFFVKDIEFDDHDTIMSLIQGLPHFAEISFAHTMQKLGFKLSELMPYVSPATDLKLKMVGRILAQDPELYSSIQLENPENQIIAQAHLDSTQELTQIIQDSDYDSMLTYFKESADFLGAYKEEALSLTDEVISRLKSAELISNKSIKNTQPKQNSFDPNTTLATLGPKLTHTDLAATTYLEGSKLNCDKRYFSTITEVCDAVMSGEALIGIIPLENKLHGSVRESLDNLFKNNLTVFEVVTKKIDHCLASVNGVNKDEIKIIMSHSQALNQCGSYLKEHFPNAELVAVSSSAHAFKKVSENNFRHIAVIGTESAARSYNFNIISSHISDSENNETKFGVMCRETEKEAYIKKSTQLVSIVFNFEKDSAGSLFEVFKVFKDLKINMTKVESRPYLEEFGNYLFYIDFEGDIHSQKIKQALESVQGLVSDLKVIGSY